MAMPHSYLPSPLFSRKNKPIHGNGYIVDAYVFYIYFIARKLGILAPQIYKPYPELAITYINI